VTQFQAPRLLISFTLTSNYLILTSLTLSLFILFHFVNTSSIEQWNWNFNSDSLKSMTFDSAAQLSAFNAFETRERKRKKSSNFCDVIRCASDFRNHCFFQFRIYFYCSDYLLGSQFFLCLSFFVLYFFAKSHQSFGAVSSISQFTIIIISLTLPCHAICACLQ